MQAAEIALNIIIFLPIPSLPVFFATCSSWSHLSELEYIWHVVYERELHAAGKNAANSHEQNRIEKLKKKHLLGAQDFKTKGKTYVHLLQGFAKGQYAHHDSLLFDSFVKDWRLSISTVLTWPRRMFCNPKFRIMEHVFRHARHAKDCNFDDLHKIVKYVHSFGNPTNLLSRMSQYNATIFYGMEVDNEQFVTMLAGLYKEELKMSKLEDNFELPLFDILQHASNRNVHLVDWIMQADMFNVGLHGLDPNLDLLMDVLPIGSNEKSIVNFVCYNNYPNILLALSKYAKKPIVLETKWLQRGLGGCTHTPDAEVYLMFPWTGDPNIVDAQGESIAKSFVRTENECQADLLKRLASMGATFTELHNDKNILQTMFELDHFHLAAFEYLEHFFLPMTVAMYEQLLEQAKFANAVEVLCKRGANPNSIATSNGNTIVSNMIASYINYISLDHQQRVAECVAVMIRFGAKLSTIEEHTIRAVWQHQVFSAQEE